MLFDCIQIYSTMFLLRITVSQDAAHKDRMNLKLETHAIR